jgi:hypothetical protein
MSNFFGPAIRHPAEKCEGLFEFPSFPETSLEEINSDFLERDF